MVLRGSEQLQSVRATREPCRTRTLWNPVEPRGTWRNPIKKGETVTKLQRASCVAAVLVAAVLVGKAQAPRLQVVPKEADRRVDILIDGKPFTSYIWPTT